MAIIVNEDDAGSDSDIQWMYFLSAQVHRVHVLSARETSLDCSLYLRTANVLEAAGSRWNRKAQAHLFEGNALEIVEQILLTGEISSTKDFGYFPTPAPLVAKLMELARIEPWMLVLESSAGRGAIAREIANITLVECFEILPENATALRAGGYARSVFLHWIS